MILADEDKRFKAAFGRLVKTLLMTGVERDPAVMIRMAEQAQADYKAALIRWAEASLAAAKAENERLRALMAEVSESYHRLSMYAIGRHVEADDPAALDAMEGCRALIELMDQALGRDGSRSTEP